MQTVWCTIYIYEYIYIYIYLYIYKIIIYIHIYIYIRYWHTAINFISNARNHQIILVPNAIFISVFKNVEDDNTYSTFYLT